MKNTANAISIARIVLTLLLIVFSHNITLFVILYILCGVSDFLDGYIARKTKTTSTMGARIDSAADIIWFISITAILVAQYGNELFACLPLLAATFLVRCFNAVFAAVKYHSFVFLHTWGNKLSGLLVFIAPLPYMVWHSDVIIWTVCMVCILAAVEEGLIHLTSAEPDPDRRSIFS